MVTLKKPSRPWNIDDLMDLGKQSGVAYLKAIPVLILAKWVQEKRQEGVANFVRTKDLARRVVNGKLKVGFKPKSTSNIGAALSKIQRGRNLNPPLVEFQGGGKYWINLPYYEPLLQEYRQTYSARYPEDYENLFPEGEPDWQHPSPPPREAKQGEEEPLSPGPEVPCEVDRVLATLGQSLRDQDQAIQRLAEKNQNLAAQLAALQDAVQEEREATRGVSRIVVDEELRDDCAELLSNEEYHVDAIRRAGVVLEERLRKSIGGDGSEKFKFGVDLVDYALAPSRGKLIVSEHPGEQDGVHKLFRGAVQFVRNPPSHKKVQYTESEAREAVGLIDYLLSLLQQARPREG